MSKKQPSGGRSDNMINRRDFIFRTGRSALGGAMSLGLADALLGQQAGAPAAAAPAGPKYETLNQLAGMTYTPFGKTNLMVSRMTLGGIPWQPIVARKAISLGVNLVHGANEYGTMEQQVQTLGNDWDKFWYGLKYNTGREKSMAEAIETCLKTIKKDHVDIIFPTVYGVKKTDYAKLKEEFETHKKAGKVRFIGATLHASGKALPDICREVVESGIFDTILTMYQPDNKAALDKELAVAVSKNIGTMSMKTLQGANGDDQKKAIFKAALSDGTIHTVLKGQGEMGDLNKFMEVVGQTPMPSQPKVSTAVSCLDSGMCGGCGNCVGCPQNVAIPDIMRCATYYAPQGWDGYAADTYRQLASSRTVLGCIDCGLCEQQCPRSLAIRRTLRQAHERWA